MLITVYPGYDASNDYSGSTSTLTMINTAELQSINFEVPNSSDLKTLDRGHRWTNWDGGVTLKVYKAMIFATTMYYSF